MRRIELRGGEPGPQQTLCLSSRRAVYEHFTEKQSLNPHGEHGRRSRMHFKRGENPFKSQERTEIERDERQFGNCGGML